MRHVLSEAHDLPLLICFSISVNCTIVLWDNEGSVPLA